MIRFLTGRGAETSRRFNLCNIPAGSPKCACRLTAKHPTHDRFASDNGHYADILGGPSRAGGRQNGRDL